MSKILSSDSLFILKHCIAREQKSLETLHWDVCSYLPPAYGKKGENATETLRNIARTQFKIEKAHTELCALFDKQYSQKDHARAAGMSVSKWRRLNKKQNETKIPVGNPSALPKERKTRNHKKS